VAEMQDHKFLIAVRYRPYIEFASVLRGHTYSGLFESHVTVSTTHQGVQVPAEDMTAFIEQFKTTCKEIHCKPLLIELPSGKFPTQLMTSCYHRGELKVCTRWDHLHSGLRSWLLLMWGGGFSALWYMNSHCICVCVCVSFF
jgi:hypothetical protein